MRKYLDNIGWLLCEKLVSLALNIFVVALVARYLGSGSFGLLSFAIAVVTIFYVAIGGEWMNLVLVRDIVKMPNHENEIMGVAVVLKCIFAIVAWFCLYAVITIFSDDNLLKWLLLVIALGAGFRSFNVIELWFHSRVEARYSVHAKNAALILSSVVKIVLVKIEAPLIAFAWVVVLESIVFSVVLLVAYHAKGRNILNWSFSVTQARVFLRSSLPMLFTATAGIIYMRIDQVMLKVMVDNNAVGIYSAGVRLSELWYFIPLAIVSTVFPVLILTREADAEKYMRRLQGLYSLLTFIAIAVAVPVTFFAENIVHIIFGPEYMDASNVLRIYIWSGVFMFLSLASTRYLVAEDFTGIAFIRNLIGMILNVAMNYVLIPRYGINGAAVATLLSYGFAVFSIGLIRKTRGQFILMLRSFVFTGLTDNIRLFFKQPNQ